MSTKSKKKPALQQSLLSPTKYVKTKARSLPWGKCYINDNWKIQGMATIVMTRVQPSGKLIAGIYLVDVFCMGLKQTTMRFGIEESELNDLMPDLYDRFDMERELAAPVLLQNIIYGAIEYAEDLGFSFDKDFYLTEYILDPADDIGYIDIDFGKDGKPFYVEGPFDKTLLVLAKLTKAVGADNFDFLCRADQNSFAFEREEIQQ